MKKYLSILLAVMMVLSTVSFAAPSLAGVADTAVEAPAFEAPAADLAAEENILKSYEFNTEGDTEGVSYASSRGWKESQKTEGDVGFYSLTPGDKYSKLVDVHSNASIAPNLLASEIQDILVRVRFTNYTAASYAGYVYVTTASSWDNCGQPTWKDAEGNTVAAGSEWVEVSVRKSLGEATWATKMTGTLKYFRFDFTQTHTENTIIDIDYIRFVGLPKQTLTLNMGGVVADQTVNVTEATTVADVLTLIDLTGYEGDLQPKAINDGDTRLAFDAKVADYDALTVVWGSLEKFGYDFDEALAAGLVAGDKSEGIDKFKLEVVEDGDNKIARFTTQAEKESTDEVIYGNRGDRARMYLNGLNIPAGEIKKITFKMRYVTKPANGTSFTMVHGGKETPNCTYDATNNMFRFWVYAPVALNAPQEGVNIKPYTMPEDDDWFEFTIDYAALKGDGTAGMYDPTLNPRGYFSDYDVAMLRFDFWNAPAPAGIVVEIDDIQIIGGMAYDVTLDLSDAGLANQASTYTAASTAATLLKKVDGNGVLVPYAVKVGNAVLGSKDKLSDFINDGDTVKVLFKKSSAIINAYEFTNGKEGASIREGASYGVKNSHNAEEGTFRLTFKGDVINGQEVPTTKFNDLHSGSSFQAKAAAGELSDVRIRVRITDAAPNVEEQGYWTLGGYVGRSSGNLANLGQWKINYVNGEWVEISLKERLNASSWNTLTAEAMDYLRIGFDDAPIAVENTIIDIDYVRFYREPVTVTLDNGDVADAVEVVFSKVATAEAVIADAMKYVGSHGQKTLVGLKAGETELAATDVVANFVENGDTLTAVWADTEANILDSWEFDANESDLNLGGLPADKEFVDGTIKGRVGTTGNQFYLTATVKPAIPADKIDDIVYRVRYTGATEAYATNGCVWYFMDSYGEDGTSPLVVDDANHKKGMKLPLNNDVWTEISLKKLAGVESLAELFKSFNINQITGFRLPHLMRQYLPEGATMELDYVRVIGFPAPPVAAPTSLVDETAMRNVADEKYGNAIRFKATVDADTKASATEIGWLVSTAKYLDGRELTIGMYDKDSSKVKVEYQKVGGEDALRYFDESDDNATVFAAFVYNIPKKNAQDTIVVRPFAAAEGEPVYGDAIETTLLDMLAASYLNMDDIDMSLADFVLDQGYVHWAAALEDGFVSYNDAYYALDEEQQVYVDEIFGAMEFAPLF